MGIREPKLRKCALLEALSFQKLRILNNQPAYFKITNFSSFVLMCSIKHTKLKKKILVLFENDLFYFYAVARATLPWSNFSVLDLNS